MVAKRRKFDTRTILIILLVVVIIAAAYILITNLPPEDDTLTPEDVFRNENYYLNGEPIIVRGHYVVEEEGPAIVSTLTEIEDRAELRINYSSVANATDILISGVDHVYKFTGTLTLDENDPLGIKVIFIVEKIVKV